MWAPPPVSSSRRYEHAMSDPRRWITVGWLLLACGGCTGKDLPTEETSPGSSQEKPPREMEVWLGKPIDTLRGSVWPRSRVNGTPLSMHSITEPCRVTVH